MLGRRLIYLLALTASGVFYLYHGAWFSAILALTLLALPWLSLLLSIPAIRGFRVEAEGARILTQGEAGEIWLLGSSGFPLPPFKGKLWLYSWFSDRKTRYQPLRGLPAAHCGGFLVTVEKPRICDYLGIFSFPAKAKPPRTVLVRPKPQPIEDLPDLNRCAPKRWRPKAGGGFAENHELRLYRPGDSLNQVHWKLSAKTGKLTVREALEPIRGLILVTMDLSGTPEVLDRKLGQLLWLGTYLVNREAPFELRVLTREGVRSFHLNALQALERAVDSLLCTLPAREGSLRDRHYTASWQYHIGGEAHEAQ